jgi:hypothetical protein
MAVSGAFISIGVSSFHLIMRIKKDKRKKKKKNRKGRGIR